MATNTNDKYTEYHSDKLLYTSNGWINRDQVKRRGTGIPYAMIFTLIFVLFVLTVIYLNSQGV